MNRRSEILRKQERMTLTIDRLVDHFLMAKQAKGCSPKTLTAYRADLSGFLQFPRGHGHSMRLVDLTVAEAREFVSSMQGKTVKWWGILSLTQDGA